MTVHPPLSFPLLCMGVATLSAACDAESHSTVAVEDIAAPSSPDECTFSPDNGSPTWSSTTLNTVGVGGVYQYNMQLRARVTNLLAATPVELDDGQFLTPNGDVKAVRFDFEWECDAGERAFGVGPMFVPGVAVGTPFCRDRSSDDADFAGRFSVAASGQTISPLETGLVSFNPIPTSHGQALSDALHMAELANLCCLEVGGCDNVADAEIATGNGYCRQLQIQFDTVDSGGSLIANSVEDVSRWQPFATFTYPTDAAATLVDGFNLVQSTSAYPFQTRGRFEFVDSGGDVITSNELVHSINVCRNCALATTPCTAL